MKKIIYIAISATVLISLTLHSSDQKKRALWKKAAEHYQAGNYKAAFSFYQAINLNTATLFYNTGNCLYHLADIPQALSYWKAAYCTCPPPSLNKALAHNCSVAQQVAPSKRKSRISYLWYFMMHHFWKINLLALQLIFFTFWLLLFFVCCFYRKKKFIMLLLLGTNFLLATAVGLRIYQMHRLRAIVKKESPIFTGPGKWHFAIGTINPGTLVTLCTKNKQWCKISDKNLKGWVHADTIIVLP